jgi:ABC-2 type transport system permease protein
MIAGEVKRLLSTRIWLWGTLAALASGGFVALLALVGPENFQPPLPPLRTEDGTRALLGMVVVTTIIPAMLGTTAITSEYRHQTITITYLFVPRRWAVLAAKLGVYAMAGLLYGLIAVTALGLGLVGAAAVHGTTLGLPVGTVVLLLLRISLAMAVYMVLGVAVGALLRNQIAAVLTVGIYLYVVETALLVVPGVHVVYPFLPGGATAGLTGFTYLADATAQQTGTVTHLLSAPVGALVLLAYVLVASAVAVAVPLRRDVA